MVTIFVTLTVFYKVKEKNDAHTFNASFQKKQNSRTATINTKSAQNAQQKDK